MISEFIVNGFPHASDIALTTARVAAGTFFALSGYHKLFNADRHATMLETLIEDGIPFPKVNAWFVAGVEFFGGMALIAGLLTPVAALGLLVICLVACGVDGLKRIESYHPIDNADWVDDLLYLPEAIYILILATVVATGAGPLSLDRLIFG